MVLTPFLFKLLIAFILKFHSFFPISVSSWNVISAFCFVDSASAWMPCARFHRVLEIHHRAILCSLSSPSPLHRFISLDLCHLHSAWVWCPYQRCTGLSVWFLKEGSISFSTQNLRSMAVFLLLPFARGRSFSNPFSTEGTALLEPTVYAGFLYQFSACGTQSHPPT